MGLVAGLEEVDNISSSQTQFVSKRLLADDVQFHMRARDGFTLLEICLAIVIALLLLGLALPLIGGINSESKLNATLERFDDFARQAQLLSVSERRAFVMVWDEAGISIEPESPLAEDRDKDWPRLDFEKDEVLNIERTAALEEKPPMEWPFWRSGTCEPIVATYSGPAGSWVVKYDPLTVRPTVLEQNFGVQKKKT